MPRKCCVSGCESRYQGGEEEKSLSFHKFPKDIKTRCKWEEFTGVYVDYIREKTKKLICSEHFAPECFDRSFDQRLLIKGSIPSINLPVEVKYGIKERYIIPSTKKRPLTSKEEAKTVKKIKISIVQNQCCIDKEDEIKKLNGELELKNQQIEWLRQENEKKFDFTPLNENTDNIETNSIIMENSTLKSQLLDHHKKYVKATMKVATLRYQLQKIDKKHQSELEELGKLINELSERFKTQEQISQTMIDSVNCSSRNLIKLEPDS